MSHGEANKAVRVLRGERLKFTCHLHLPDGAVIEFQSNYAPSVRWHEHARGLWVVQKTSDYDVSDVMPFTDGAVLLTEENPK